MYCIYCGKPIDDKQKFCGYCGEEVKYRVNDDEKDEKNEAVEHVYVEKSDTSADGLIEIFKEMNEEKEAKERYQTEKMKDEEFHLSFTGYVELIVLIILFIGLIFYFKKWVIDPKPEVIQKVDMYLKWLF